MAGEYGACGDWCDVRPCTVVEDTMAAPENRSAWSLTIEVGGMPPSPNRRTTWQARRRIVKPIADAVATLVHRRPPLRDYDNAVASLKERPQNPEPAAISS
jgi:hypothetical protein